MIKNLEEIRRVHRLLTIYFWPPRGKDRLSLPPARQLQWVSTNLVIDINICRKWMFTKDGWCSLECLTPTPWCSIFRQLSINSYYHGEDLTSHQRSSIKKLSDEAKIKNAIKNADTNSDEHIWRVRGSSKNGFFLKKIMKRLLANQHHSNFVFFVDKVSVIFSSDLPLAYICLTGDFNFHTN